MTTMPPVVDVIKLCLEEFWKIQISPKLKQQEQAISKAINSLEYFFASKQHCFHIFVEVQILEQTIFHFLILGKSRFPQKKFYNINYWADPILHVNIGMLSPCTNRTVIGGLPNSCARLTPEGQMSMSQVNKYLRTITILLKIHDSDWMLQVTWLLVLANKSALFHGLSICKLMRLRWGGRSILTPEITVLVSASIYKFSV